MNPKHQQLPRREVGAREVGARAAARLLHPHEVTSLLPHLRQAGADLAAYERCDCGGEDCPLCDGTDVVEVIARYYVVDMNADVHDVCSALGVRPARVRLMVRLGLRFACVT